MTDAVIRVVAAGPHVSVQDGGRPGLARFGVPHSGPMDRIALAAGNTVLGNDPGQAGIEVSLGGLMLECLHGELGFAVAGGGFVIDHAGQRHHGWFGSTLRAGEKLVIRPGFWGTWACLALAGRVEADAWLGSRATHVPSGLGGGKVVAGQVLRVSDTRALPQDVAIPVPVFALPRHKLHVTLGPQDDLFPDHAMQDFLHGQFRLGSAYDRMGVRLTGPALVPESALDIASGPIARGSVQVDGQGVATVLLADHQTTGGYPRIATVLDADLDAFVQLRPGDQLRFRAVSADEATAIARTKRQTTARYLDALRRRG
ncbi:biotin-dependent carboxyltransferase family protein [Paracoccus sp. DMF-8]|uniref:5-oxoprolinase subunit C family protein n=1 Tax=Paracoccus sp. DMF-8 TaxID=3019445 RepID=UPI0023E788CA|nr:biotin-dependent carboxyltransferase family protein [Paracoccus sp. DMF-8]MDF3605066.1 biotin-dependent carboxyltransferase family protein [Paracoccus sp. DMF-8]